MSAPLSAKAVATIQGARDGERLVVVIREGCAPADALLDGLQQVLATGDEDRLRGFCRELGKALERRA